MEEGWTKGRCGHAESPILLSGGEILWLWACFWICAQGPATMNLQGCGASWENFECKELTERIEESNIEFLRDREIKENT